MADLEDLVLRAGGHEADLHVAPDRALHHAHEDDDAAVGVILAVEDERLQRRVRVALRGGDIVDDAVEHGLNVDALLGADLRRVERGDADDVLDLGFGAVRVRHGQIDLVDDGQDLEIVVEGEIGVRERLRLDALRGVHDQHRALAGRERPADLIVEVHVARGVDQVQRIGLAVSRVVQTHGAGLDRDAALALELHVV